MERFDSDAVAVAFRKCPSYDAGKETILSEDIAQLLKNLDYDRTLEQIEIYTKWWLQIHDGVLPLELVSIILGSADNIPRYIEALVNGCDFNKNGFISEDEFRACIHCVLVHDPDFPRVNYNEFLQQADKNLDGKVSIDEAVDWCVKNIKTSK